MELNLEGNLGKYFSKTMYHSHAQKFSTARAPAGRIR